MESKFTIEQKYNFLLSKLKIHSIDGFENDALISLDQEIYFQFCHADLHRLEADDKDYAVEQAMIDDAWDKENAKKSN